MATVFVVWDGVTEQGSAILPKNVENAKAVIISQFVQNKIQTLQSHREQ